MVKFSVQEGLSWWVCWLGFALVWPCNRTSCRWLFWLLLGSPLPGAGSLESEAVLRRWPIGLAWSILMFVVGGARSGCVMPVGDIFVVRLLPLAAIISSCLSTAESFRASQLVGWLRDLGQEACAARSFAECDLFRCWPFMAASFICFVYVSGVRVTCHRFLLRTLWSYGTPSLACTESKKKAPTSRSTPKAGEWPLHMGYENTTLLSTTIWGTDLHIETIFVGAPEVHKGIHLDCGYRIDLFVEGVLILELKSVDKLTAIHEAQLLTYMKLADVKIGLLINFNVTKLKDGIKRFVLKSSRLRATPVRHPSLCGGTLHITGPRAMTLHWNPTRRPAPVHAIR